MSRARRLTPGSFALLLSLLLTSPFPSSAQEALPPEAEQAMQRGYAAAKQQEWELAIKYFEEAREGAPRAPDVLFNLALAHDRLGGRELIVSAWYRAYLAADPNASNANQVRKRVVELEVATEAKVIHLVSMAKELALQISVTEEAYHNMSGSAYFIIVVAQAETGDMDGAMQTYSQIKDETNKMYAVSGLYKLLLRKGEINGAKKLISLFPTRNPYTGGAIAESW